jgi:RNA polymerase sigma factor for flagellar operon FliA
VPLEGTDTGTDLADVLPDAAGPDALARLLEGERLADLSRALDRLPERDRLILVLSYYEELTLREIGELLEITESRVSRLRTRALARLSEGLLPKEEAA